MVFFSPDAIHGKQLKYLDNNKIVINTSSKTIYHMTSASADETVYGPATYKWTFKMHNVEGGGIEFGTANGFISQTSNILTTIIMTFADFQKRKGKKQRNWCILQVCFWQSWFVYKSLNNAFVMYK